MVASTKATKYDRLIVTVSFIARTFTFFLVVAVVNGQRFTAASQ
jgi:hypothetical protein